MKFLRKEFCFWVVPPADGPVRKVRLSLFSILSASAAGLLIAGFFLFIASDYVRIQMVRARSFLHLKTVTAEREKLREAKASLEGELSRLRTINERASSYQQEVRRRMEELGAILRSAQALGLPAETFAAPGAASNSGDEEQGLGGAETVCEGSHCRAIDEPDARGSLDPAALSDVIASREDALEVFDRYIEALRFFPISAPVNSHTSSGFGLRRSPFHLGIGMHEGIDFNMPAGSMITASADGVVREVRRCPTYGLVVDIAHSDRVVTRYAHLSTTFVSAGEKICRSEVIGLVGSTGRSTGPHLHYEVLVDGRALNPMRFIELAKQLDVFLG